MLNIKSMFSGLRWWLSTGCLPLGTEPVHQWVWWEEKAEDGLERKGRERGRTAGSREGSWELAPAPQPGVLQPPQGPSAETAQGWAPVRRDRAPGVPQETGPSIAHIPSHLPPLHLPKLDIAMKKD